MHYSVNQTSRIAPSHSSMSLKNMFGSSKKKLVEVTGDSSSAPAKPTPPPPADDEKQYELEVPPNTLPGAKLKLTIPGMTEKVVITVPEGAVPGATIQFSLPKSGLKPGAANEATQVKLQQERAAIMIQARMRGNMARQKAAGKLKESTKRAS